MPPKYHSSLQEDVEALAKNKNVVAETSTLRQIKKKKKTKHQAHGSSSKKPRKEHVVTIEDDGKKEEEESNPLNKITNCPKPSIPDESSESEDSSPGFQTMEVF